MLRRRVTQGFSVCRFAEPVDKNGLSFWELSLQETASKIHLDNLDLDL